MDYRKFKQEVMSQPDFGRDPAEWEKLSQLLLKLNPAHQGEVIGAVLHAAEAGLIKREDKLFFAPISSLKEEPGSALPLLFSLLENQEVVEKDREKIFTSHWLRDVIEPANERDRWVIAYYNFRKNYAALFIEALKQGKPFTVWNNILYEASAKLELAIELKQLIIKVLESWPTGGRSGYALLCQLREIPAVKSLEQDRDVKVALDHVEGRCDFGSLEKVRELLKEAR